MNNQATYTHSTRPPPLRARAALPVGLSKRGGKTCVKHLFPGWNPSREDAVPRYRVPRLLTLSEESFSGSISRKKLDFATVLRQVVEWCLFGSRRFSRFFETSSFFFCFCLVRATVQPSSFSGVVCPFDLQGFSLSLAVKLSKWYDSLLHYRAEKILERGRFQNQK